MKLKEALTLTVQHEGGLNYTFHSTRSKNKFSSAHWENLLKSQYLTAVQLPSALL